MYLSVYHHGQMLRTNGEQTFIFRIHINSGGGTGFETYRYSDVGRPTSTYQEKIHEKTPEQD